MQLSQSSLHILVMHKTSFDDLYINVTMIFSLDPDKGF